jgi:hypothetical protein
LPVQNPSDRRSDKFEEDHFGRIGLAGTDLDDPGVAAVPLGVAGGDLLEQLVDGELVLAQDRKGLAPGVKVTALAEGDQLLDLRLGSLVLGLAGLLSSAFRWAESRPSLFLFFAWRIVSP